MPFLILILTILLPMVSVFLILLILVQRGRGGGLVGAFGGMGGQSAFGAKAGDLFTRITVVTVCIWLTICISLLLGMKHQANVRGTGFGEGKSSLPAAQAPAESGTSVPIAE